MKFIDALDEVQNNISGDVYRSELIEILQYLDEHPELTGRTITQSDYQKIIDETSVPYGVGFTDGFNQAGGSIIPDPTNAERIIALMGTAPANLNRRELAKWLDSRGVKALGGDDE